MKRLRGVLGGFRSTVGSGGSSSCSTPKADNVGFEETIWSEHLQVAKVDMDFGSDSVDISVAK